MNVTEKLLALSTYARGTLGTLGEVPTACQASLGAAIAELVAAGLIRQSPYFVWVLPEVMEARRALDAAWRLERLNRDEKWLERPWKEPPNHPRCRSAGRVLERHDEGDG